MTNSELLESIKSNYLQALDDDALNPRPDYSIDGQTVSRAQWRDSLLMKIKEINALIQADEPYELHGFMGC